jgi:hypothetical protein
METDLSWGALDVMQEEVYRSEAANASVLVS